MAAAYSSSLAAWPAPAAVVSRHAFPCNMRAVARFEFKQEPADGDLVDKSTRLLNLVVRAFGLVLLLVGMCVALLVISSAWSLYDKPELIERFAIAVEHGSHLDSALAGAAQAGRRQVDEARPVAPAAARPSGTASDPAPAFRFSYFVAWLIALLLLLLMGRLSIAAVRTGGELALYDVQVRRLARAILLERSRPA